MSDFRLPTINKLPSLPSITSPNISATTTTNYNNNKKSLGKLEGNDLSRLAPISPMDFMATEIGGNLNSASEDKARRKAKREKKKRRAKEAEEDKGNGERPKGQLIRLLSNSEPVQQLLRSQQPNFSNSLDNNNRPQRSNVSSNHESQSSAFSFADSNTANKPQHTLLDFGGRNFAGINIVGLECESINMNEFSGNDNFFDDKPPSRNNFNDESCNGDQSPMTFNTETNAKAKKRRSKKKKDSNGSSAYHTPQLSSTGQSSSSNAEDERKRLRRKKRQKFFNATLKIQMFWRFKYAYLLVSRIRRERLFALAARSGVLLACKGTAQGKSGWYQQSENSVPVYYEVNGRGEWKLIVS